MSKIKYHYNTKTLQYERYVEGWRQKVLRVLYILLSGAVFSGVVILFSFRYLNSPKEKQYQREIENLQVNYKILQSRLEQLEQLSTELKGRDNDIYRVIFEAQPIPDNIRNAGFGGVNRYEYLEGYNFSDLVTSLTQRVDIMTKQLVVQSKSYDEIWDMVKNRSEMLASIPAIMPINKKDLKMTTSGFGYRIDPIYKTSKFHAGMDFVAETGKPIYASGNGVVSFAGTDASGYGMHVKVNHGYGYLTLYGHMSEIKVVEGQKVKRGDLLGLVGSTGKSVGPHLHYEVHKNGEAVNPVNYYFSDITPEEYQQLLEISRQPSQAFD